MQRRIVLALCVLLIGFGLRAQGAAYRITPDASSKFELLVKKTGLMSGKVHVFAFPQVSGELQFNEAAPEQSKITLRIDAAGIQCKDDWVSEKDRAKVLEEATGNMLQVIRHKELVFVSKSIRRQSDGGFAVDGDLSIRGVPKPATVQVRLQPGGQGKLRFTGESVIDMTAWGLKPPRAALGAIGTDKLMTVRFAMDATR
jgi:polyisoprenoid-binding protein YceI